MNNYEYEIETKVFRNGIIKQQLKTPCDIEKYVTEWVMNTREEHMKKALIELGWIPPEEIKNK